MTLPEDRTAVKAITKNTIREQVYADFDSKGFQKTWPSMRHHIPRFPNVKETVAKLADLPEYQNASTVVTKTGDILTDVRFRALKDKKKLLIPIPFPSDTGTLYLIEPPEDVDGEMLEKFVTRTGVHEKGKVVPVDSNFRADIIVLGSVAVDKQGRRIGSGKDYCDLELAVMAHKGMITKDTIIATIVHDIQVMESLPEEVFGEHDMGVNLIITPTQIIRVDPPPKQPTGVLWKLVTKWMLQLVPALEALHQVDMQADPTGCELKQDSSGRELRPRRIFFRRRKPIANVEGEADRPKKPKAPLKSRQKKQRSSRQSEGEQGANKTDTDQEQAQDNPAESVRPRRRRQNGIESQQQNGARRRIPRRPYQVDFSLCVRNLASDVRVRDLKNALAECQVKPAEIKWRGHEGYAILHFARDGQRTSDAPTSMDGIITSLRNLNVSATQEDGLVVEPYTRVTRIEVTDQVTAV